MKIDFIGGMYKGRSTTIDSQECVNLYPELSSNNNSKNNVVLIGTPGKKLFLDIEYGIIRGMYTTVDNRCFVVSGNKLYEIFADKNKSYIGKIRTSTGKVSFSENETQLIIIDGISGWLYYLTNGTEPAGTFSEILSITYQKGTSVINIDRYFIQNVSETGYFICSSLGNGNEWDVLDTASAERSPDKIITIGTVNNELWVMGSKSVEVWYNSGAADFPFSRINNAFINIGITAKESLGVINNSIIWLGGNSQGQGIVWLANGYIPKRISNHAIEYLINSFDNISDAYSWVYQQEGHYFYVLNFPSANKTLCYDLSTDMWHERGFYNKKTGLNDKDIAYCQTLFNGINYVSDYRNAKIYELDLDYYYDDETLIKRVRTGGHIHSDRKRLFFSQFEIDLERGVSLESEAVEETGYGTFLIKDSTGEFITKDSTGELLIKD